MEKIQILEIFSHVLPETLVHLEIFYYKENEI